MFIDYINYGSEMSMVNVFLNFHLRFKNSEVASNKIKNASISSTSIPGIVRVKGTLTKREDLSFHEKESVISMLNNGRYTLTVPEYWPRKKEEVNLTFLESLSEFWTTFEWVTKKVNFTYDEYYFHSEDIDISIQSSMIKFIEHSS